MSSIKYNNNEITGIQFKNKEGRILTTTYPNALIYRPTKYSTAYDKCVYCKPVNITCTSSIKDKSTSLDSYPWDNLTLTTVGNIYNLVSFESSETGVTLSNSYRNTLNYNANYGDSFELLYEHSADLPAVFSLSIDDKHIGSYALESWYRNEAGKTYIPITLDNTTTKVASNDNYTLNCRIGVDAYIFGPWPTVYDNGSSITQSGRTVTYKLKIKNEGGTPVWIHNFWCTNTHIENLFRDAQIFESSSGSSRSVQLNGNSTTEFKVTETVVGNSIKIGGTFYFSIKDVPSQNLNSQQIKNLRMARVIMPNSR